MIRSLLLTTELNLDELEPSTRETIQGALQLCDAIDDFLKQSEALEYCDTGEALQLLQACVK